jgi:S1-C subfamily serine protease
MLSANRRDKALLDAVSSSISTGYANPLGMTENGHLATVVLQTIEVLSTKDEPQLNAAQPAPSPPKTTTSSGTGFVVSAQGHILTNDHVVDSCSRYTVDGKQAERIAGSPEFDLALLKAPIKKDAAVAVFSAAPPRLNSDVTVVGYPYGGALSGLNVTRGSVSSLKGLGGDATRLQITAPVQQGNSGGPLVAADGEIVGVIVSKLDVLKFADAIGDVPQNVNFAVRGEIAKLFLSQNGITPALSLDDIALDPTEIAERTAAFTVFIECH